MREQPRLQPIAQAGDARRRLRSLGARPAARRRRSRRCRSTFSVPARRSRSWCPPAGERRERHAPPQIDRAHALGPVKLVRRQRQRVDAQRVDVDVELSGRLHRVGVKQRARFVRDARQRRDVVDVAQSRGSRAPASPAPCPGAAPRAAHPASIAPSASDGDVRHLDALGRQRARHRRVLERATTRRAPVRALAPRAGEGRDRGRPDQPAHRQLIPLRPPRREHDLLGASRPPARATSRARVLDRRARRAPRRVRARRVARQPAQRRRHRVGHLGPHGRGRVVVEVDVHADAQYTHPNAVRAKGR